MEDPLMGGSEYLWPGRFHERLYISTRQYVRIVRDWVASIGLEVSAYGTHSMRRTKVTQIYKKTGNLRAVQLLLGHTKMDSTVLPTTSFDAGKKTAPTFGRPMVFSPETGELPVKTLFGFPGQDRFQNRVLARSSNRRIVGKVYSGLQCPDSPRLQREGPALWYCLLGQ
jgi:hypothetical protein